MSKANPPPPQKEAAYGVQIDVGLPCFRNEGLEGIRTLGPAAPEGRTILVPPVHLFGWEGSHCNPNGRASMVKNMEDHTAIQKGRAPTAPNRKAHTAIRSGELPRGLKERAPYMNQGRDLILPSKRESPHCDSNGRAWTVSGWGSPHGDSNGRAHSRSGSFCQSEKGELSLHPDEKGALRG